MNNKDITVVQLIEEIEELESDIMRILNEKCHAFWYRTGFKIRGMEIEGYDNQVIDVRITPDVRGEGDTDVII